MYNVYVLNKCYISTQIYVIEEKGLPNAIFNPWVRWNTWPAPGQEFFRRRGRRRRPPELQHK